MTRRQFIRTLFMTGAAASIGLFRVAQRSVPRRIVRAAASARYPGRLRPLRQVDQPGIWRG
jgi:hypothetical protein